MEISSAQFSGRDEDFYPSAHEVDDGYSLVKEALSAYESGQLLEWQIGFLNSQGNNSGLANNLARLRPDLEKPRSTSLDEVHRIIGPGPRALMYEEPGDFYSNVERCEKSIASGNYPAPLLAAKGGEGWTFILDGNHTKMALEQLGFESWWVIITEHPDLRYEPKKL